eukprot:763286-Hanusia_phi.AAC.3
MNLSLLSLCCFLVRSAYHPHGRNNGYLSFLRRQGRRFPKFSDTTMPSSAPSVSDPVRSVAT